MFCCVSEDGQRGNGRTVEGAGFLCQYVQGMLIYCGIRALGNCGRILWHSLQKYNYRLRRLERTSLIRVLMRAWSKCHNPHTDLDLLFCKAVLPPGFQILWNIGLISVVSGSQLSLRNDEHLQAQWRQTQSSLFNSPGQSSNLRHHTHFPFYPHHGRRAHNQ